MLNTLGFEVFPCGSHEWCACRVDGLVCGYFQDRIGAIRFARRESCDGTLINVSDTPRRTAPLRAAA